MKLSIFQYISCLASIGVMTLYASDRSIQPWPGNTGFFGRNFTINRMLHPALLQKSTKEAVAGIAVTASLVGGSWFLYRKWFSPAITVVTEQDKLSTYAQATNILLQIEQQNRLNHIGARGENDTDLPNIIQNNRDKDLIIFWGPENKNIKETCAMAHNLCKPIDDTFEPSNFSNIGKPNSSGKEICFELENTDKVHYKINGNGSSTFSIIKKNSESETEYPHNSSLVQAVLAYNKLQQLETDTTTLPGVPLDRNGYGDVYTTEKVKTENYIQYITKHHAEGGISSTQYVENKKNETATQISVLNQRFATSPWWKQPFYWLFHKKRMANLEKEKQFWQNRHEEHFLHATCEKWFIDQQKQNARDAKMSAIETVQLAKEHKAIRHMNTKQYAKAVKQRHADRAKNPNNEQNIFDRTHTEYINYTWNKLQNKLGIKANDTSQAKQEILGAVLFSRQSYDI